MVVHPYDCSLGTLLFNKLFMDFFFFQSAFHLFLLDFALIAQLILDPYPLTKVSFFYYSPVYQIFPLVLPSFVFVLLM